MRGLEPPAPGTAEKGEIFGKKIPAQSVRRKTGKRTKPVRKKRPERGDLSASDMLDITFLTDPEIVNACKEFSIDKEHPALVSSSYEIFSVKPDNNSKTMQLSNLRKAVAQIARINPAKVPIVYVPPTVYESYQSGKADGEKLKRDDERDKFVDEVFNAASSKNASDVHLIKSGNQGRILLRINQILRPYGDTISGDLLYGMIRSMWNNYKLEGDNSSDYAASQIQDTSFEFKDEKRKKTFMIRGNSIPEKRGVKVTCRLRDQNLIIPLKDMGYMKSQLTALDECRVIRGGLVLVTGPTNSGKSTTITTMMNMVDPMWCVVEVGDPIELVLPHCFHFEVDNRDPESLDNIVAALMRQDPDFAVLGEIRTKRNVDASTKLAFSGMSVWSTLHNGDIPGAFLRLLELGLKPKTLADENYIQGIVSQNLVQTLCPHCSTDIPTMNGISTAEGRKKADHFKSLFKGIGKIKYWYPGGCSECDGGFTGLTLAAEVLKLDDGYRDLVANEQYNKIHARMRDEMIPTKHVHAGLKVVTSQIDPWLSEVRTKQFNEVNIHQDRFEDYFNQYPIGWKTKEA